MSTLAFKNQNPQYLSAGQSLRGAGRYDADGYRYSDGRKKMRGYSRNLQGAVRGSGLDEFHARQKGVPSRADGPAFQGSTAEDIAEDMNAHGERSGFGGRGKEPNRNLSQRERDMLGLDSPAQTRRSIQRGPTDRQRGWAAKNQEGQRPAATTPTSDQSLGGAMGGSIVSAPPASSGSGQQRPPNFSRASLIEGAKKSGDFDSVKGDYNAQARGTGQRMDQNGAVKDLGKTASGPDGTSAFARDKWGAGAEDIRARRNFAEGRTVDTSGTTGTVNAGFLGEPSSTMQAPDFRRTISSSYGTGSNVTRGGNDPAGGMMADPLTGKQVPIKQWTADQVAVQNTKYGPDDKQAGEDDKQAGEDYLDPKAMRKSISGGGSKGGGKGKA